jgi:hypothetical protein
MLKFCLESKWNFLRKKFGHQLVAAKLTESNTAANTLLGLGFDFTMLILNQTIEFKKRKRQKGTVGNSQTVFFHQVLSSNL